MTRLPEIRGGEGLPEKFHPKLLKDYREPVKLYQVSQKFLFLRFNS
jgi:hypothetical protein